MSDTPSGLEEYMPCVYKEDDLKVLLRSKAHWGQMAGMDASGESVFLVYQPGPIVNELTIRSSESDI